MVVTLPGTVMLFREVQPANTLLPIVVMFFPMEIDFRLAQSLNASGRICVTGFPKWVSGMVISLMYFIFPQLMP